MRRWQTDRLAPVELGRRRHPGVVSRRLVADDHSHQFRVIDVLHVDGSLGDAVAQHRRPIRQLKDLVEPVRDVDDARPVAPRLSDEGEEGIDLVWW